MHALVCTPWHNPQQRELFEAAWKLAPNDPRIVLQRDADRSGCALTKNRAVARAVSMGAKLIIVLDDDCFPCEETPSLDALIDRHAKALEPQPVQRFRVITDPPSRGTPYYKRKVVMPVAASMGFWEHIGDYDAVSQLAFGPTHPMRFTREPIFGDYFALSGMNLAFHADWAPWAQFINVPRMDDIWMGFLWQKRAYAHGFCFNLNGPLVRHSRQSDVFMNLQDEAKWLVHNESLWQKIEACPATDYETLRALLPV